MVGQKESPMVNRPDTSDILGLPEGVDKVEWHADTRFPLCGNFIIHLEDHTLGNLIRNQLARDPRVIFAGYRVPHPLEYKMEIRVQTVKETPYKTFKDAVDTVRKEVTDLKKQFMSSVQHRMLLSQAGELQGTEYPL